MQLSHCGVLGLLNPLLANCVIYSQTVMLSFSFQRCSYGQYCTCQGSQNRPDPSRLLCAYPFLCYYMKPWGVWANNFQICLRPAVRSAKSHVLPFPESQQILPHINSALISWTVRNGETLVLLWEESEFDWQGPALDFCWIKSGKLPKVRYIKTAICIFAAILKGISSIQWSTTSRRRRMGSFNITNDTRGVTL